MQQQAQKDAQTELDQLQPRIPKLTIIVEGANVNEVVVKVDDVPVPSALLGIERYADPGQRKIIGKRGNQVVTETATLAESTKQQVILKFQKSGGQPLAAPGPAGTQTDEGGPSKPTAGIFNATSNVPPARDQGASGTSRQRTWGWICVGVGGAGLALGATTGILVALKYGDLNGECDANHVCSKQYDSAVGHYHTMQALSTVGFIVGGAATAAGVTLLLASPKQRSPATVGLWILPSSAGVKGEF